MTAHEPLHWSQLTHLRESPAHYKHALEHPAEPTNLMKFGSLVHAIALGKTRAFTIWEGERGAKGWKAFKEQHAGEEILTTREWSRAVDCADAVKADPVAGPLLREGYREHTITWKVGERECAGTPDLNGSVLVDLKVSGVTKPERFPWHAQKMGWHGQLAWYGYGIVQKAAEGLIDASYMPAMIIAVEPKPPHCCVVYSLTPETIQAGHRLWRSLFETLMVCEASEEWPGYAQQPVPLELPDAALELEIDGEVVTL